MSHQPPSHPARKRTGNSTRAKPIRPRRVWGCRARSPRQVRAGSATPRTQARGRSRSQRVGPRSRPVPGARAASERSSPAPLSYRSAVSIESGSGSTRVKCRQSGAERRCQRPACDAQRPDAVAESDRNHRSPAADDGDQSGVPVAGPGRTRGDLPRSWGRGRPFLAGAGIGPRLSGRPDRHNLRWEATSGLRPRSAAAGSRGRSRRTDGGGRRRRCGMVILPRSAPRFVSVRRGGTQQDDDHRLLAMWAADCAEHVLHHFEQARPKDERPRRAIDLGRAWARGQVTWWEARTAAGHANAAAGTCVGQPAMPRTLPARPRRWAMWRPTSSAPACASGRLGGCRSETSARRPAVWSANGSAPNSLERSGTVLDTSGCATSCRLCSAPSTLRARSSWGPR